MNVSAQLRKFFSDTDGNVVIWQMPNTPLIAWILFSVGNHFVQDNQIHQIVQLAATLSLLVWAILEIKSGASPFRRFLGVIVLLFIIIQQLV